MAYPSLEQYNQAFQLHSRLLTDPELKSGTLTTTGYGTPLGITGGFALTYTIKSGAQKYAVRCFHKESKALERRYSAISRRLASLRSPYFVDFQFQPQGIKVNGIGYPIVKMAGAKGETLGEFLDTNHDDASALSKLSDALVALSGFLEKEQIAHGDLQPGNLMVSTGGSSIELIDYDGMYVDEIKDIGSTELGHGNFQHPQRKAINPFAPDLDRFSLISLAIALKALRVDPSLWRKTNSDADAILFRANDFADPGSSPTFALLSANSALADDAHHFASVCRAPMDKAPSLADFLAGKQIPAVTVALAGVGAASAQKAGYISTYGVLSAMDYAACLRQVGDKVEVIGRITDVKENRTRNGKPYVFINFGDWRGQIFKVSIWSEGLAAVKIKPDASWIGKWLSVVGLMEPPYVNPNFNYSHLSINVTAAGQMTLLSESDAQWRLAGPVTSAPTFASSSNRDALDRIKSRPIPSQHTRTPSPAGPSVTRADNRAAIEKIRALAQPAPTQSAPSAPPARHMPNISAATPPSPKPRAEASQPHPPPREKGVLEKLFGWLFG